MPLVPTDIAPPAAAAPAAAVMDELETYLELPVEKNMDLDVLAWWKAKDCTTKDGGLPVKRVDASGQPNWNRWMNDTAFLRSLRDRGRACGLPAALCKRFQFHGFRSGGASDWFNYGHQTHPIIEFIQRQGRWNSTAFRISGDHSCSISSDPPPPQPPGPGTGLGT